MLTLKIIHLLAVITGVGFSFANLLVGKMSAQAAPAAMAEIGPIRARLGQLSFLSLVVLWITGIWMFQAGYGGGELPMMFRIKIALVILLTFLSVGLQYLAIRAARRGQPPPPKRMKNLGMGAGITSVLVVISAVMVFGV